MSITRVGDDRKKKNYDERDEAEADANDHDATLQNDVVDAAQEMVRKEEEGGGANKMERAPVANSQPGRTTVGAVGWMDMCA